MGEGKTCSNCLARQNSFHFANWPSEVEPYMSIISQAIHQPDVVFQSTRRKNTHIFYKLRVDKKGHHIARVERTRNKPSILANIAVASHPGRL